MQLPSLSVIVPTKNEERIVEACLRSLRSQQTDRSFEILVVDANSHDRTIEIAETYGARVIREPRPGKSLARQTGAQAAAGEFLCFTEADCQVPPIWIETIARALTADEQLVAVTGPYVLADSTWFYNLLVRSVLPASVYAFYALHRHHSLRATNFAIRASALARIGGFNTATRELDDVDLSLRASKHGRIGFIPGLMIKTSDRRFRNRLGAFLKEFLYSYVRVGVLRREVTRPLYEDIR